MAETFSESWFHAPGLTAIGETYALPEDEAHHLRKVLRIEAGRQVIASDGAGGVFLCATRMRAGAFELEAQEIHGRPAPAPRLHLALSLLKGRDLEEPVDALCQLEVACIHILTTEHTSEFKGQDHARLLERLRAKSLVGLKQAKKAWLTAIEAPRPLEAWRGAHSDLDVVVLHPGPDRLPPPSDRGLALLCGPEGGLSDRELERLHTAGAYAMGLGDTRIRAVHAPLLAAGKLMGLGRS